MKKAIVIYDTIYGNTERIAKALAEGIREKGIEVECVKVDQVDISNLAQYDFLAIGGPTHGFGLSNPMKGFLEKLKNVNLSGKRAFAFDTKMKAWWAGSAGSGIEGALKGLQMNVIKPQSSAIVKASEGPLEEGAEEAFKQIGIEIAGLIP